MVWLNSVFLIFYFLSFICTFSFEIFILSPVFILLISIRSMHGISAIIAPTAIIGSHSLFMRAIGAVPFFFILYMVYEPTVEPFP